MTTCCYNSKRNIFMKVAYFVCFYANESVYKCGWLLYFVVSYLFQKDCTRRHLQKPSCVAYVCICVERDMAKERTENVWHVVKCFPISRSQTGGLRGGGGIGCVGPFADSAADWSSVVSVAAGRGGEAVVHLLHSFLSMENKYEWACTNKSHFILFSGSINVLSVLFRSLTFSMFIHVNINNIKHK
jgi:hypothetical protein